MLTLVLRRARVQRRMLGAVVLLVATACTLVGTCALLLGVTQERAFHVAIEQSRPDDVSVTAFLVDVASSDAASVADDAGRVVDGVVASMRPRLETTLTSRLRDLGPGATRADAGSQAYLMASDGLTARADLTSGRWPEGSDAGHVEAVVPDQTARRLGLALGDEVTLGGELGLGGVDDPVALEVVGTFRPLSGVEWERDPLGGSGFSAAYSDGLTPAPTYGPFVVGSDQLIASGSSLNGVRVTAHPDLTRAQDATLRAAVSGIGDASGLLTARVGDRVRITRLATELPRTLERIHVQQASTASTVLVVLLLGSALSLAAALLAGRLIASVREIERDLLVAMGTSRRQQVLLASFEAALLAVAAVAIAVPAAALVHSRLTHLPALEAAGLRQGPAVTPGLVLAVVGAAVLLVAALVSTSPDRGGAPDSSPRGRTRVRSGFDVLLVLAAALAWWQLRSRATSATVSGDALLTLAPVLCLAALTVLGVRLVPLLLAVAGRAAVRSPRFVLPLAAQQAARRPHRGTAMVLVAAAVAAAVFGVALRTTWGRSQDDQATLRVGADLALTLPGPPGAAEATQVREVLERQDPVPVASTVIHRPLVLGRYVGEEGARPELVALDARRAGSLLRGRLDGTRGWSGVVADLAAPDAVAGLPVPEDGAGIRLRGTSPDGSALNATPTAVLEDPAGFRSSVAAAAVPLDGAAHVVDWLDDIGPDLRLVAVRLEVDSPGPPAAAGAALVPVRLTVPDAGPDAGGAGDPDGTPTWQVQSVEAQGPVGGATEEVRRSGTGFELLTTLSLDLTYLAYDSADVVATAFVVPDEVPVVVSQDLVDAVGVVVGGEISALVGDTTIDLHVVGVVPTVPSAPGQVAVLADSDLLSRVLLGGGRLDPVVDGWWVAHPSPDTVRALQDARLGDVVTRQGLATELSHGPLRVTVPTALLALVALAVAMLLAAVGLVLGADRQSRSHEVVRLRALGVSRSDARRLQLVEHLALFVPLVLVGAVVGAAAAVLIGPLLVRSELGAAPVPPAVVAWPWATELLLVGGLLVGSLLVTVVLSVLLVRGSAPSRVREGEA